MNHIEKQRLEASGQREEIGLSTAGQCRYFNKSSITREDIKFHEKSTLGLIHIEEKEYHNEGIY